MVETEILTLPMDCITPDIKAKASVFLISRGKKNFTVLGRYAVTLFLLGSILCQGNIQNGVLGFFGFSMRI
ncbi:MAG: hypothetical protein ABSG57_08080 [Candidatus Bathyarchaeia archaeon]|jgi:hypothetical protein